MDLHLFEEAFTSFLGTATERPLGLAEIPEKNPNLPYGILYPINSPRGYGDYINPESMREYVFQITCVGKTPKQARWYSDKMKNVIIGVNANGDDVFPMPVMGGVTVCPGCRQSDALGAIVKTGDALYQIADTYRIKVA